MLNTSPEKGFSKCAGQQEQSQFRAGDFSGKPYPDNAA